MHERKPFPAPSDTNIPMLITTPDPAAIAAVIKRHSGLNTVFKHPVSDDGTLADVRSIFTGYGAMDSNDKSSMAGIHPVSSTKDR